MKRAKRLQPVIDLAELKSRQGLQAIAYMQKRVQEEQEKLAQLSACKDDYELSKNNKKQTFSSYYLKSFRDFSKNLELAMEQQSQQINAVEGQLQQVRQHWQTLDAKCKSLLKTQAKIAAEESKIESAREQKQQDEFVSQTFARTAAVTRAQRNSRSH